MKLRTRIQLTRGGIWLGVAAAILSLTNFHWIGYTATGLWLIGSRQFLHALVLPLLFPFARCRNGECGYLIPLTQFWSCGGHYKHPVPVHALAFRCSEGHEIKDFDCPRCNKSTIQLQKGTGARLHRGTIIGNPMAVAPSEWRPYELRLWPAGFLRRRFGADSRILLGFDRRHRFSAWQKLYRRCLGRPLHRKLLVEESTLGRHAAFIGATGQGKSVLMTSIIAQKMQHGQGLTVIDPTGDLIRDVLRQVPERRRNDVLLIRISDSHCPIRLNLLHAHDEIEELNINNEVLSSLRRLARSWGDSIALQIDRAIDTVRPLGGSLQDVYDLFTDSDARYRIANEIKDGELREFWLHEYAKSSYRSRSPVITKLRPLVNHKLLGPILCSRESNFDPDSIIGESKIVLLDLSTGSHVTDVNTIVGTFVFTKLIAAAWRRGKQSQKDSAVKRMRHTIFVDEAQNYMHHDMGVQTIISEARKFKLTLAIATTHVDLLSDSVRKAVINNMGLLAVFWVGPEDAAMFKRGFQGVTEEDIASLDIGQCIIRNHRTTSFVRTRFPLPKPAVDSTAYIENRMLSWNETTKTQLEVNSRAHAILKTENGLLDRLPVVCEGVT